MNLSNLIKGEIIRLKKYKILTVGVLVSFLWAIIIGLSKKEEIISLIPMLMSVDATLMSIILLAASFYFEKQEGTIKSILVAPVRLVDVLLSKIIATFITSLISTIIVYLTTLFIHHLNINIGLLLIYVFIIVVSHTAIGFLIILSSKDFATMIGRYAIYALIAVIPSILYSINIIPEQFGTILLISPSYSSQVLMESLFLEFEITKVMIAIIYLILICILLYFSLIYKKFKKYVMEE